MYVAYHTYHEQPDASTAFLGCTPERLFLSKGSTVVTEALAGTRGRGDTKVEDERLGKELMANEKVRVSVCGGYFSVLVLVLSLLVWWWWWCVVVAMAMAMACFRLFSFSKGVV